MRPLRLEMKGFGAFREKTVVDFNDVELAAFVGPTGSGKSTIIDGITFALFGVVARYDDRRAVAPAINQMANEAQVSLDFEVDSKRYTAVRVVRRTNTGATTREARLERDSEVLAGMANEMEPAVEQILGLDFDRFTKTVVLPQGRFAAFLHDKPSDRQELLRQLLDLGIYERMGGQARQRANTAKDQLEVLEPRLDAEVPSEEQVAQLAEALETATAAQATLNGLLKDLDQSANTVASAREEAGGLALLLLAATGVTVPQQVLALGDELQAAQTAAADAREALEEASRKARAAEQAAQEGPNVEMCKILLGEHQRLAVLVEQVTGLDDQCESADEQYRIAAERASGIQGRLELLKAAVEEASAAAQAAQQELTDGPDSVQLALWRDQRTDLARLSGQLEAARKVLLVEQEQETKARENYGQARATHRETGVRLDEARAVKQAEGLVAQLVEGEPCPVCRQPVHELPDHDLDAELEQLQRTHADAEEAMRKHEETLDEARTALSDAEATVKSATTAHDELVAKLADAPDDDEINRLSASAEELAAAATEAQAELTEARQAETDLRDSSETKETFATEQTSEKDLTSLTAGREGLRSQRDELVERLTHEPEAAALKEDIALAEQLAATSREAQHAETEAQGAEQTARETLEELAEAERQARNEFAKTRDGFAALEPPMPQASLVEDWQALDRWASQLADGLIPEIDAANEHVDNTKTQQREHELAARVVCAQHFDPSDDPQSWRSDMATAVERARYDHQSACTKRKEMADLEAEVEGLRTEQRVAGELGRLLRSDGFERWLLAEAVGDLLDRASERLLALSNGQYSFDADGTGFDVCDHHNADQKRQAKTLSGGETFLASLALALALSDSHAEMAPEGSPGLDSLFLDEGFGTLDPETLDVTAAAIEELGASGRMVAIVTHIRELAERMPLRFEVAKTPTTSTVTRVTA